MNLVKHFLVAASFLALSSTSFGYTGKCNRAIAATISRPLRQAVAAVDCPGGLDLGGSYSPFHRTRLRGCWVSLPHATSFGVNCTVDMKIEMSTPTGVEADGCKVDSVTVYQVEGDRACEARFHEATGF